MVNVPELKRGVLDSIVDAIGNTPIDMRNGIRYHKLLAGNIGNERIRRNACKRQPGFDLHHLYDTQNS